MPAKNHVLFNVKYLCTCFLNKHDVAIQKKLAEML